ncbi:DUF58 domain-containing protein [bacterium]|nr:DUF58 domain-containing protein [Chloroflexi bacterium CFX6]RIL11855.1 MAG: DUF58 domain-containing protein [bacterium]
MNGRFLLGVGVVVAFAALITNNPLLVRLGYVLGGVLGLSAAVTWYSVRWVEVERQTRASRSEVGGVAEEVFRVHNRGWLPKLWLEVRDHSDLPGHHASRVVSALGPGRMRTWTLRTLCRRRGVYRLGPITLAGGDPLGIFRTERELEPTSSYIVYPLTVLLRGVDLPTGYLSGGQVIRRRAEFATTNVRGVRAYAPGDAFNRIHWPTTARRRRLFTKEFELDPIADFWILLDLDRAVHVGTFPEPAEDAAPLAWHEPRPVALDPTTEEYAVTAAASLARHFLDAGKSVGLIAHGQRRIVVQPDRGERQVAKILGNLAVLRAAGRASLAQVLSVESHEFTRHTTLVVVTPTTAVRWIEGLRELQHRGVASLAVLVEASTFGAAPSSLGTVSALAAHGIPSRLVKNGADVAAALTSG